MSSDRQIEANRSNAKGSTGPRSKSGRAVSSRNALRLGLAVDIAADPLIHDDIAKLSNALSPSSPSQEVSEYSRQAAEAQLDLMRIRKTRAWLFDMLYFAASDNPSQSERLQKLSDGLAKLERYERRALSRRKRALRSLQ
jgi:hypothetical protein